MFDFWKEEKYFRVNYTLFSSKMLELHSSLLFYLKIYTSFPTYSKHIRKYFTPLL